MENWGKDFREDILAKILLIKNGIMKPEFPIPEKHDELKKFLRIEKISTQEKHSIRLKLRNIAKEDSANYESSA